MRLVLNMLFRGWIEGHENVWNLNVAIKSKFVQKGGGRMSGMWSRKKLTTSATNRGMPGEISGHLRAESSVILSGIRI